MGVLSFYKKIIKKYNDIITDELNSDKIRLFFDFNALIHYVLNIMFESDEYNKLNYEDFEDEYIKQIIKYIKKWINIINENNSLKEVYICTDGIVPRSKMIQQRLRRFKNFNKDLIFDRNSISPGTKFMRKLSKNINIFLENNEYKNIKILYYDDLNRGEGEQIVFKKINELNDDYLNVIYSLDADVIMLSMLNYVTNIFLLREKQEFEKNEINNDNDNLYHLLDINKLRKYICMENDDVISYINKSELIIDLIFLFFLLGNDFVPHVKELNIYKNGMDLLVNSYKTYIHKYKKSLIEMDIDNKIIINNNFLIDILSNISINENYLVSENSSNFNLKIINYKDKNWKKIHNKYYFNYESIDKVCKNYVESLKWTLQYYIKNEVPQWNWYYRWRYGPPVSNIIEYLRKNDINNIEFIKDEPISFDQQLFMILPKESKHLIKEKYWKYIDNELEEYFPYRYKFDRSNCHAKWQFTPILPEIDYNLIKRYIN